MSTNHRIAAIILDLCTRRGPLKTICPSEAARALTEKDGDWRTHMDDVRRIGAKLAREGHIDITQRGKLVDQLTTRGPIRFRVAKAHQ